MLAKVGGLPCAGGESFPCAGPKGHDPEVCKRYAREFNGTKWPTCPTRSIMSDSSVAALLRLERLMELGPVEGWPRRYAAWVPRLLLELKRTRAEAEPKIAKLLG